MRRLNIGCTLRVVSVLMRACGQSCAVRGFGRPRTGRRPDASRHLARHAHGHQMGTQQPAAARHGARRAGASRAWSRGASRGVLADFASATPDTRPPKRTMDAAWMWGGAASSRATFPRPFPFWPQSKRFPGHCICINHSERKMALSMLAAPSMALAMRAPVVRMQVDATVEAAAPPPLPLIKVRPTPTTHPFTRARATHATS